jgi:flagellar basal body-associated protein FliL
MYTRKEKKRMKIVLVLLIIYFLALLGLGIYFATRVRKGWKDYKEGRTNSIEIEFF